MSLKSLFAKVKKAAVSKEGRAAIAVASLVLPAVAPKAVAKGVKLYRKAKVVKDLAVVDGRERSRVAGCVSH